MKPSTRTTVVMRFSERTDEIDRRFSAHIAGCPMCRAAVRAGSREEPFRVASTGGCIAAALLFSEWITEYERLHSPEERAAHDDLAREHGVGAVADAIRAATKARRGGAA